MYDDDHVKKLALLYCKINFLVYGYSHFDSYYEKIIAKKTIFYFYTLEVVKITNQKK